MYYITTMRKVKKRKKTKDADISQRTYTTTLEVFRGIHKNLNDPIRSFRIPYPNEDPQASRVGCHNFVENTITGTSLALIERRDPYNRLSILF